MTKREERIVKLAKAMAENSFSLYEYFKSEGDEATAKEYFHEWSSVDTVIKCMESTRFLEEMEKIFFRGEE